MNNVERIKLLKIAKNGTETENVSQVPMIDAYPEMFLLKVKNLKSFLVCNDSKWSLVVLDFL